MAKVSAGGFRIHLQGRNLWDAQRAYLVEQHKTAERAILRVIVPILVLVYVGTAIRHPSWQTGAMAAGVLVLAASWTVGFRRARYGKLESAVRLISAGGLFFGSEILFLREGSGMQLVVIFMTLLAYVALYHYRLLARIAFLTTAAVMGSELVQYFRPYPLYTMTRGEQLAMRLAFIGLFLPITTFFLRRSHIINSALLRESEEARRRQDEVLGTITSIQPEMESVVRQIKEVADGLAVQASQQASSSSQINGATGDLAHMVAETVAAADEARNIAQSTRRSSQLGGERLQQVESGFRETLASVESVRSDIGELARRIEETEAINRAINEIAENLRFLAVNAGIEAARAAEHGRGFAVVATELKRMIDQTSQDLLRSRKLLDEIRLRAGRIDRSAEESTGRLRRSFEDLGATGSLIESIGEGYARTAERVEVIAGAAARQQSGITEVSASMGQLDAAAARMKPAAATLTEGVDRIIATQQRLRGVLVG